MNGVSYLVNVKPVQLGKNVRMSFSKINEVLDMPNLIEIQKDSFQNFVASDLSSIIGDFSPIDDFSQNMRLANHIRQCGWADTVGQRLKFHVV